MTKRQARGAERDNGTAKDFVLTKASDWKRKPQGITLPSGMGAMLLRPRAMNMILRDGSIPNSLAQAFSSSVQKGAKGEGGDKWELQANELKELAVLLDKITVEAFVEPKVVTGEKTDDPPHPNYKAGEIHIDDVDEEDKLWLLQWALEPLQQPATQSFRSK